MKVKLLSSIPLCVAAYAARVCTSTEHKTTSADFIDQEGLLRKCIAAGNHSILRQHADYYDIHRGVLAGTYVLNHYLSRSKTVQEALHKYSGGAKNYYAKVMCNAENYKGRD